jgi:hypothetical protein
MKAFLHSEPYETFKKQSSIHPEHHNCLLLLLLYYE